MSLGLCGRYVSEKAPRPEKPPKNRRWAHKKAKPPAVSSQGRDSSDCGLGNTRPQNTAQRLFAGTANSQAIGHFSAR
jgi:hypothetical protein